MARVWTLTPGMTLGLVYRGAEQQSSPARKTPAVSAPEDAIWSIWRQQGWACVSKSLKPLGTELVHQISKNCEAQFNT